MILTGKKNDKGYTLVELVVVIAIMVVMTGVVSFSLSIVFNEDAQRAVALIDDELTETKMLSMSKAENFVMTVYTSSTNPSANYIMITKNGSPYKRVDIDKDVFISVKQGASQVINPGENIVIEFNKSTGSVTDFSGLGITDELYEITAVAQKGNKPEAKVSLITNTGRHFIEK